MVLLKIGLWRNLLPTLNNQMILFVPVRIIDKLLTKTRFGRWHTQSTFVLVYKSCLVVNLIYFDVEVRIKLPYFLVLELVHASLSL